MTKTRMSQWRLAIANAKRNGCSARDCLFLIDRWFAFPDGYFRGEGALFTRLSVHRPGMSVEEGWPPPDPDYVVEKTVEGKREMVQRMRDDLEQRRRQCQQDRIDAERREREYGAVLDAMTDEERNELIRQTGWRKYTPAAIAQFAAMVRVDLLEAIERRETENGSQK